MLDYDCFTEDAFDDFSEIIKECPLCHKGILPKCLHLISVPITEYDGISDECAAGMFRCPSCNSVFFAHFTSCDGFYDEDVIFGLDYACPEKHRNIAKFTSYISDISPCFVETFNQSEIAESMKLHEIAGIGYRKAIEYLIKDFCAYMFPDKTDDIKSDNKLSNVIANRIPDKPEFIDIKDMAKSSWILGCDFVHYDKKYIDYNIEDLKACIDLTVTAIEFFLKKSKYSSRFLKK